MKQIGIMCACKVLWIVVPPVFFIGDTSYSLHLGHIRVFLLFPSGDGFVPERTNGTNLGSCFPERGTVAGLVLFFPCVLNFSRL